MSAGPEARAAGPYVVRRFRSGDEAQIIRLYERTFGRTMGPTESARHWAWEFLGNPSGRTAVLLAESEGSLAAQYAVMPLTLRVDGRDHPAALSLDTATDAAHRGRGLFPRLARQLYAELAAEGYAAVFGFPNAQSAPIFFNKLEWVELKPFPLRLKPLRGAVAKQLGARGGAWRALAPLAELGASVARRAPRRIPPRFVIDEIRHFGADADDLWDRAAAGKRIAVVRDQRYLEWRYVERPENRYRIHALHESGRLQGLVVTAVEDRHTLRSGFLMDLVCEEGRPDVAAALVSVAESSMARDGAEILSALAYPGGVMPAALAASGFLRVPERFFPQEIHFGVRTLAAGADPGLMHDPTHWYLTWGDSDVV